MTDLRKAAEMALEALDCLPWQASPIAKEATQALRQALAQPEQECTCPAKDMHFGKCCKAKPDEVLAEREACAEWLRDNYQDYKNIADICEAIRARGEK